MASKSTHQILQEFWGKSVRAKRGDRSQTWLARRMGVDQTTISKIERGNYRLSPELMIGLAAALGCELDEVFAWPPGIVSRARYEQEIRAKRTKVSA